MTRVAAYRGRELTGSAIEKWNKAARADGADKSGLTALTYPVILNFAIDAAVAVALANTLFFAAAQAQSKSKVALYLLVNIAPFALIAPFIGPMLDRIQHGRRIALAVSFLLRTGLAITMISNCYYDPVAHTVNYDPWVLYPCALGMLVLSKSFSVLKSAVTPRVLPPTIDLAQVNSRLTVFGLVGGTIAGGAIAAMFEIGFGKVLHLPGALWLIVILTIAGAVMAMRIPKWVENTSGEVPTTIGYTTDAIGRPTKRSAFSGLRAPLGRTVITGLWGNATIRILTGFLTLYIAFYGKAQQNAGGTAWTQVLTLGMVGVSAGLGNFLGNALGARMRLGKPGKVVVQAVALTTIGAVAAAIFHNLILAAIATFIASATSAIAKVSLDASIQNDLPDESRASAFGRSETMLQLGWVFGAALGVLLPTTLVVGFTVVAVLLVIGFVQTLLSYRGQSLVPGFGGKRPEQVPTTGQPDADQYNSVGHD